MLFQCKKYFINTQRMLVVKIQHPIRRISHGRLCVQMMFQASGVEYHMDVRQKKILAYQCRCLA